MVICCKSIEELVHIHAIMTDVFPHWEIVSTEELVQRYIGTCIREEIYIRVSHKGTWRWMLPQYINKHTNIISYVECVERFTIDEVVVACTTIEQFLTLYHWRIYTGNITQPIKDEKLINSFNNTKSMCIGIELFKYRPGTHGARHLYVNRSAYIISFDEFRSLYFELSNNKELLKDTVEPKKSTLPVLEEPEQLDTIVKFKHLKITL